MTDLIDTSQTTVLIVDDNPVNIKVVRSMLEKTGYRTITATGGVEGIEAVSKSRPDLVLLDIIMPGMSGIEVCKVLKQDEQASDLPIIFVTASTENSVLKEAFESGGTDYVRKPVNKIELLARIKTALTERELMKRFVMDEKLKGVLEMAGAVCHEINQPMQAISGYSELLLMCISEGDRLYGNIRKIKDQVVRMGDITRKLMRITKYETRDYLGDSRIIDINKASEIGTN